MLRFSLFHFPVRVHWTFGLIAFLLGGGLYATSPEHLPTVLTAVTVIFLSILVHELGHAFAGRRFGAHPSILLHSMGGLCYLPGARLTRRQNIAVSLAGPGAGFMAAGITLLLLRYLPPDAPLLYYALEVSLFINFVWSALNLLPILPLDGGQVCRDLLGPSRIGLTRKIGMITAALACLAALAAGHFFSAVLAASLAIMNYQGYAIDQGGTVTAPPPDQSAPYGRGF